MTRDSGSFSRNPFSVSSLFGIAGKSGISIFPEAANHTRVSWPAPRTLFGVRRRAVPHFRISGVKETNDGRHDLQSRS
jgi:hypothetical protein